MSQAYQVFQITIEMVLNYLHKDCKFQEFQGESWPGCRCYHHESLYPGLNALNTDEHLPTLLQSSGLKEHKESSCIFTIIPTESKIASDIAPDSCL